MTTKEKIKKTIDRLSETEVEKLYAYLSSLTKKKKNVQIRTLKLKGKMDDKNIRSVAYE